MSRFDPEISGDSEVDLAQAVSDYVAWVEDDSWVLLEKSHWEYVRGFPDHVVAEAVVVPCVKRGNALYSERLLSRISRLSAAVGSGGPFWSLSQRFVRGRWLWITLELNSGVWSLYDAWMNIRRQYNRFITWVRKEFGRVKCWTFLQAHSSGYPHLHVIAQFLEHEFSGFRHVGRGGKISFRCDDKSLFAEYWRVGFVDVKMVQSVRGVMSYGARYGSRSLSGGRADLTLALGWKFKRRGFTMGVEWSRLSRGISPSVDVISSSGNSTASVSSVVSSVSSGLVSEVVEYSWKFCGVADSLFEADRMFGELGIESQFSGMNGKDG